MHGTVQLSTPLLAILFGVQLTVPLLAILGGILFNRADVSRLSERIDKLEIKIDKRFDTIERDLREFYGVQRQHETRLDALEREKK